MLPFRVTHAGPRRTARERPGVSRALRGVRALRQQSAPPYVRRSPCTALSLGGHPVNLLPFATHAHVRRNTRRRGRAPQRALATDADTRWPRARLRASRAAVTRHVCSDAVHVGGNEEWSYKRTCAAATYACSVPRPLGSSAVTSRRDGSSRATPRTAAAHAAPARSASSTARARVAMLRARGSPLPPQRAWHVNVRARVVAPRFCAIIVVEEIKQRRDDVAILAQDAPVNRRHVFARTHGATARRACNTLS